MTNIERQVSAGTDDFWNRLVTSAGDNTSAGFAVGCYNTSYYQYGGGARFTNITIPQGATINSSYLIVVNRSGYAGSGCKTRIYAEDVDDAATFANDIAAFNARWAGRTSAYVDWDISTSWPTINIEYSSPDIKSVIQEIVNRAGWSSGNSIVLFWDDFDDRSTHASYNIRDVYSYDGDTSKCPKLSINYTSPVSVNTVFIQPILVGSGSLIYLPPV